MLTADLVKVSLQRNEVRPAYIRTDAQESLMLSESLIEIFKSHVGEPRFELDNELEEFLGTGTAFILHRGLAKLLLDRCEFESESALEPYELRCATFEAAAAAYRREESIKFDRSAVIEPLLERLELDREHFEQNLYADLKNEQTLKNFKHCTSDWLLKRYNVALTQAILLRATELRIRIENQSTARYRELFRMMKFFQLLFTVEGTMDDGYEIRLDGPYSLFKSSQRYGLQMANFLPALLHCDQWELEATVLWGKQRKERKFHLSTEAGLTSHTRMAGQWQPAEMSWLMEQFPKLESEWEVSEGGAVTDLGGQGVFLPDYVFTHRQTRQQVWMEIFGFWRRGGVGARLELLQEHGVSNVILALSRDLYTDEEALADFPGEVYIFRSAPNAKEVLEVLLKFEAPAR